MNCPLVLLLVLSLGMAPVFSEVVADNAAADGTGEGGSSNMGQISLSVDHSLDEGLTFSSRGMLVIQSLRSGSAWMDSTLMPTFTSSQKESLRKLCRNDGLYSLRLTSPDEPEVVHRTAVHACNLVDSGLSDIFTVHLDWRNTVVGVSVMAGGGATKKDEEDTLDAANGFRSKVLVQHMETGPQPDTAAFIQRMEQEKLAKERGETKDNRSFLAKYWMYIIPVVLVLAMSGGNPEGGQR